MVSHAFRRVGIRAERYAGVANMGAIRFSRRQALRQGGTGLAAGALATAGIANVRAQDAATPVADDLTAAIEAILDDPRFLPSRLGVYVADRATGEAVYSYHADEWFLAASTTKVFAGSAALDVIGADHRFETPVYRTGEIGADGTLEGDLILVAVGDPTMGGRDTSDGTIAYTALDHIYANGFPTLAELTPQDPLDGLNDPATQIAAAGISQINGDVIIDDRLFPTTPKDDYLLSPVWINDNLIDFTLTPGESGAATTLAWRPMTAALQVENQVTIGAAGDDPAVDVSSPEPGKILLTGTIPADIAQAVFTFQIEDPSSFARILLIEALETAGVTVTAKPTGANPVDVLPVSGSYAPANQVAVHQSLPFGENLKLIFKVSHNQHADQIVYLMAVANGSTDFSDGMAEIGAFLKRTGIDPASVSLGDGRGNLYTDVFSPRTVSELLIKMAARPDADVFDAAMPILGVDGSETNTVPATSPVAGKAAAKSGTTVDFDVMNQRIVMMTRALAGYMTGSSGREYAFGIYLNNVPLVEFNDVLEMIAVHGSIAEAIYEHV
ncbi:D-alanyl-D-alanine carboxypeptidase/D-alanyl-D-alanine-endopeptidase [soil metagenome]